MKKKIVAVAMLAAMLTMSLAGCGTKSDDAKSQDNSAKKSAKYHVGVIQLTQHPALDAATEGFVEALEEKLGDEVDVEVQNASNDSATCATIANTFVADGKDLIMGNATPALQAATQATSEIPIVGTSITSYAVALGIDDAKWTGTSGINVTGTSDLPPLDEQAKMIQELYPDAKNVGVLYCSAEPNSVYQVTEITKYLKEMGYSVKEYTFSDSNDVAAVTKSACDDSDVIYIPTDNTAADCASTIGNVVMQEKTPVIAGEEGICSGCGVATLSIDYHDIGYAAGEIAYEILVNNADPADTEIGFAPEFTKKYNEEFCTAMGLIIPDGYQKIEAEAE